MSMARVVGDSACDDLEGAGAGFISKRILLRAVRLAGRGSLTREHGRDEGGKNAAQEKPSGKGDGETGERAEQEVISL